MHIFSYYFVHKIIFQIWFCRKEIRWSCSFLYHRGDWFYICHNISFFFFPKHVLTHKSDNSAPLQQLKPKTDLLSKHCFGSKNRYMFATFKANILSLKRHVWKIDKKSSSNLFHGWLLSKKLKSSCALGR